MACGTAALALGLAAQILADGGDVDRWGVGVGVGQVRDREGLAAGLDGGALVLEFLETENLE